MPIENSFEFFRDELVRLTASFHKGLTSYRGEGYDESALRNDFLTPFWRALGWDVENKEGEHESIALQRQIDHNKVEIDATVFQLYNLSAEDISLVQGNPLTFAVSPVTTGP